MAFNDALFQLGMDLTRSSPAQKEEHDVIAHSVAHHEATIERVSGRFAGTSQSKVSQANVSHAANDAYGKASRSKSSTSKPLSRVA